MRVIVQVSADVAHTLHQRGPPTPESERLLKITETLDLTLEPMHVDTDDPKLQGYFIVKVPDHAAAQRALDHLQQSPAVEGVYVKPPDESP